MGNPAAAAGGEPAGDRYRSPLAHALRARFLGRWGGEEFPVPVERIAKDELGLRVERSWDIPEDCSGMLIPAERLILVSAREISEGRDVTPLRRTRFTIAHEIGHWEVHVRAAGRTEPSFCRAVDVSLDVDRDLEREANVFAAELLMPEAAVREAWASLGDPDECARWFDVSPSAMRWRLYSFGFVAERPA